MLKHLQDIKQKYPNQYWLIFWGMLISSIGSSMIWPFLLIYVSNRLSLPLTKTASLLTIYAVSGLIASFVAGPIIDKVGRKWVMVVSLASMALMYVLMIRADTYPVFAYLLILGGTVNPLYRVGADAMLADLIPSVDRIDAYALVRLISNFGVALGPAIGGFLSASSYAFTFYSAAISMCTYSLLLLFFARETLPPSPPEIVGRKTERWGGYDRVLRDTPFISTIAAFAFGWITAALMWMILPVYANKNFNVPENIYGLIPTTNAAMVVLFQLVVTRITKRYRPLNMMAFGMLFYAVGTGSVALGHGFWGFWLSMVIITIGELIIVPTSSTYVANTAPTDMRGRYMSIYGLTWGIASGIGPVLGGWLSDTIRPQAIWYGGFLIGLTSTIALYCLSRRSS
ncbi:MAG: MFS transporter [Anaerolineales bacterium]|nr:MFS transporter [Anaerolineales bacterium]